MTDKSPNANRTRSDILYEYEASFLEGMIRAFDIFGVMPVRSCTDSSKDANLAAISGDWETVGEDLWQAMMNFDHEHNLNLLPLMGRTSRVPARD